MHGVRLCSHRQNQRWVNHVAAFIPCSESDSLELDLGISCPFEKLLRDGNMSLWRFATIKHCPRAWLSTRAEDLKDGILKTRSSYFCVASNY